jgi:glycogen phosphorylase
MTMSATRRLPATLEDLRYLAYNLRWSWTPAAREVFARLDGRLWESGGHNPVRLLGEVAESRLAEAAGDGGYVAAVRRAADDLRYYLDDQRSWYATEHGREAAPRIAYFSAEFAITECLRIFSGGLGVLAGDHLKSASDLGVPLAAVGLLYREGYFRQELDGTGRQRDVYVPVRPETLPLTLERNADGTPVVIGVPMLEHEVLVQIWRADVGRVPLYLLDTAVPGNRDEDLRITDRLYGGGTEHRLRQEMVLGIGGVRALAALGHEADVVHLNEGHAAFAAVERARMLCGSADASLLEAAARVAGGVVFTTHTPVPAGHDYFPPDLLERYMAGYIWGAGARWGHFLALGQADAENEEEHFCMTLLALRLASHRNGVSRLHGAVSRDMWGKVWPEVAAERVPIGHVTNGVHLPTWVSPAMNALYAEYLGDDWGEEADEFRWHRAAEIPAPAFWSARHAQRLALVTHVRKVLAAQVARRGGEAGWASKVLDPDALTVVFARRFATYKRATLLFTDLPRLEALLRSERRIQFVFAGKAHPKDVHGQEFLRQVFAFAERPEFRERFVFLEDYDVELARYLVQGADIWLNVPRRPYEASGTSGMKAAANGGLNLSIPDGWWAEAWEERNKLGVPIGWSIEAAAETVEAQDAADALALYEILEQSAVPLFYDVDAAGVPVGWVERMRASVRQAVPFFNTHRMLRDYVSGYYAPAMAAGRRAVEAASVAS